VKNKTDGFTLIELMITVVIAIVLLAIAIPSYRSFVIKGARADAKSRMLDIAQMEERYISNQIPPAYLSYASSATAQGFPSFSGDNFGARKYDISVSAGTVAEGLTGSINSSYAIVATPANGFSDPTCGTLRLNSLGVKTSNPSDTSCW
jgi:type IV pilus assembly protein PilE